MFNHSPFKFMILITTCLSIAGCAKDNPTQPNTTQHNQSSKMVKCTKDYYDTQGNLIKCTKDLDDAQGNLAARNPYDNQGKPINNRTSDNAGPIRPPVGGGAGGGDGGMCVLM